MKTPLTTTDDGFHRISCVDHACWSLWELEQDPFIGPSGVFYDRVNWDLYWHFRLW